MADFKIRNYTVVSRIDRRLYAVGDWVLPWAIPLRGLGFFVALSIPTWLILNSLGVPFAADTLWIWVCPPAVGAAACHAVRIQNKSLAAVITAHVSYGWWWLRNLTARRSRPVQLHAVIWRPDHPAYHRIDTAA
jgi:hypothetical protein